MTPREGSKKRPGLTPALVNDLLSKGFTQADIARMFGTSRQAVSDVKRRYPGAVPATPRQRVMAHWPWKITGKHIHDQWPHKRLRDHLEYIAIGKDRLTEHSRTRLRGFYDYLKRENLIVVYEPEEGFSYQPRVESDREFVVRPSEHTVIEPEAEQYWEFPPTLP